MAVLCLRADDDALMRKLTGLQIRQVRYLTLRQAKLGGVKDYTLDGGKGG